MAYGALGQGQYPEQLRPVVDRFVALFHQLVRGVLRIVEGDGHLLFDEDLVLPAGEAAAKSVLVEPTAAGKDQAAHFLGVVTTMHQRYMATQGVAEQVHFRVPLELDEAVQEFGQGPHVRA